MRALFAVSILVWTGTDARDAEACSVPQCWDGSFTPAEGATVPANLSAFYWEPDTRLSGRVSDPARVSLTTAAGVEVPITGTPLPNGDWVFSIDEPLVPGVGYVLADFNVCVGDQLGPTASFTAGPPAPLPIDLGTLTTSDHQIAVFDVAASGSCSASIEGDQVLVELDPSETALPWRDALMFETLVDGGRWRPQPSINSSIPAGTSWRGRGVDRVYTMCGNDPFGGTTEGLHEVTMRASLPGSTAVMSSSVPIELLCNSLPDDECEGTLSPHGSCGDGDEHHSGEHHSGCNAGGATGLFGLVLVGLLAGRRRRKLQPRRTARALPAPE
jgi:uncharacterized protein (TIGR03382 family)